jgi:hypothetical protein
MRMRLARYHRGHCAAVRIAREEYGVPTLIVYLAFAPAYLRQTGCTDSDIMQKPPEAGAEIIDRSIDPAEHPELVLNIPSDGHPTGAANRLRAEMLEDWVARNGAGLGISDAIAQ